MSSFNALSVCLLACAALASGSDTPSIGLIQNNYSYIAPGLPSYGIAPGSLFMIQGTNLNDQPLSGLQSSLSPGLPTVLKGTSISVTVNGTVTSPALYYTSPNQVAAVLPSSTPVGSGTVTVTNNGQTSTPAPIQVVKSAVGLASYDGSGGGAALAQDANYRVFSPANSAAPGQTIILWGSGVGADSSNDDKTFPMAQNNLTKDPMTVFVSGVQASIEYRGRSQYPGVDQIVVTVPDNVPVGCAVSIVAVTGLGASNSVTIPITAGGGSCADPVSPVTASQFQSLAGKDIVSYSTVFVGAGSAGAYFRNTFPIYGNAPIDLPPSLGSCVINYGVPALAVAGGHGRPENAGLYLDVYRLGAQLPSAQLLYNKIVQAYLGSWNSSTGTNGDSFTFWGLAGLTYMPNTPVKLPSDSFVWTNHASSITVDRSEGVTVTWSGGPPDTYVQISGQAAVSPTLPTASASFLCNVPVGAGQFTVPSWATFALPHSTYGTLQVSNITTPQPYPLQDFDIAFGYGAYATLIHADYN
jgi:uncharacterized protein (TIGR03437 family)